MVYMSPHSSHLLDATWKASLQKYLTGSSHNTFNYAATCMRSLLEKLGNLWKTVNGRQELLHFEKTFEVNMLKFHLCGIINKCLNAEKSWNRTKKAWKEPCSVSFFSLYWQLKIWYCKKSQTWSTTQVLQCKKIRLKPLLSHQRSYQHAQGRVLYNIISGTAGGRKFQEKET